MILLGLVPGRVDVAAGGVAERVVVVRVLESVQLSLEDLHIELEVVAPAVHYQLTSFEIDFVSSMLILQLSHLLFQLDVAAPEGVHHLPCLLQTVMEHVDLTISRRSVLAHSSGCCSSELGSPLSGRWAILT
jgi:hypothetical protein